MCWREQEGEATPILFIPVTLASRMVPAPNWHSANVCGMNDCENRAGYYNDQGLELKKCTDLRCFVSRVDRT